MNTKRSPSLMLGLCLFLASCNANPGLAEPTSTVTPAPTATLIPPVTLTPTPIPALLSASTEVPCRAGPSELYDLIVNLQAGEKVEIVGKAEKFWIVKPPEGTECWVADQQVNIEGDVSALPNVIPPPTPAPALPAPPEHFGLVRATCSIDRSTKPITYVSEFWLGWIDRSNNEDGFRIYRDGNLVAEVSANKTEVIDVISRRNPRVYYYYVTAFNNVGETKSDGKSLTCW